jgi:hypothetical protein
LDVYAWGGSFCWSCLSSAATGYRCGCTHSVAARPARNVRHPGAITGLSTLTHIAGAVAAVAITARSGWGRDWAWPVGGRFSPAEDAAAHDHPRSGQCRVVPVSLSRMRAVMRGGWASPTRLRRDDDLADRVGFGGLVRGGDRVQRELVPWARTGRVGKEHCEVLRLSRATWPSSRERARQPDPRPEPGPPDFPRSPHLPSSSSPAAPTPRTFFLPRPRKSPADSQPSTVPETATVTTTPASTPASAPVTTASPRLRQIAVRGLA